MIADDQIPLLTELWSAGVPTAEIGARLGVTRNVVIGKARRLGLSKHPKSPNGWTDDRVSTLKRLRAEGVTYKQIAKRLGVSVDAVRSKLLDIKYRAAQLVNLQPDQCRFPFGDPRDEDFGFCGAPVVEGKPYCAQHWALTHCRAGAGGEAA